MGVPVLAGLIPLVAPILKSSITDSIIGGASEGVAGGLAEKYLNAVRKKKEGTLKQKEEFEQLSEYMRMEWYHNYLVYNHFIRRINHEEYYYGLYKFSKHLLHLIKHGETRDNVIKMIEYLANIKPEMYENFMEDVEGLKNNKIFKEYDKPVLTTEEFFIKFSKFDSELKTRDYKELFESYKTKDKYVCFIIDDIFNRVNFGICTVQDIRGNLILGNGSPSEALTNLKTVSIEHKREIKPDNSSWWKDRFGL